MSQAPAPGIQLTREEVEKRLNRFIVDDDFVNAIFNEGATLQQRKAMLQQAFDGVARYALTSSKALFDHELGTHKQDYDTVKNMANEMYRERMFEKFFQKNPTLKQYEKMVQDASAAVSSREDLPTDPDKLFEIIAAETEARIKQVKPDFTRVPGDAGQQQQNGGGDASKQQNQPIVPTNTDVGGFVGGTAGGGGQSPPAAGKADPVWTD